MAALTVGGLLAVILFSAYTLERLRGEFHGYQESEQVYKALLDIKATSLSVAKADPILGETAAALRQADTHVQELFTQINTIAPEKASEIEPLKKGWAQYAKGFEGAIKIAATSPADALSIPDAMYSMYLAPMVVKLDQLASSYQAQQNESQQRIDGFMESLLWIVLPPLILVGLSVTIFQLVFGNRLHARVMEITQRMGRLSGGDFSVRLPEEGRDEITDMAKVINAFVGQLETLLHNIHEATQLTNDTANRISTMTDAVGQAAKVQSEKFFQVSSAIEQMGSSISHVATTASGAAQNADEARNKVREGNQTGQLTIAALSRIDESVSDSARTIADLDTAIKKIGNVSAIISGIAEQTNLLALNAAIEAARAGEQGRGFAVVADEVRHLASRTAASTSDILQIVTAIQASTRQAIAAMERAKEEVRQGVACGEQMGQLLAQVDRSVHVITDMVQAIAAMTEEQSQVGQDISANIDSVATTTASTASDFDSTRAAMGDLVRTSHVLHDSLRQFRPAMA